MKKLVSVGVALGLLAMVVLPLGVGAQCEYNDVKPTTYAKIPFAILETGVMMGGELLGELGPILEDMGMELPIDLASVAPLLDIVAEWTGGPLAWTVDFLAWGLGMVGEMVGALDCVLDDLGMDLGMTLGPLGEMFELMACSLFTPFVCEPEGTGWNPCGADPCK